MANGNGSTQVVPQAGAMMRQDFGGEELSVSGETAATAMAKAAEAQVQARFIVALKRPRDMRRVAARILAECERPDFAEEALYYKPVGDGIEGLSIRFAETAIREMGNLWVSAPIIYEDDEKRIVEVIATDLETNATFSEQICVAKHVERHKAPKDANDIISERENKFGKKVYVVRATEDDLANKVGALTSKKIRNNSLRLLPADIKEQAFARCKQVIEGQTIKDLPAARKRVMGGFSALKPPISAEQLTAYLGKDFNTANAAEIIELTQLGKAIRDSEANWETAFEQKSAKRGTTTTAPTEAAPASATTATTPPTPAQTAPSISDATAELIKKIADTLAGAKRKKDLDPLTKWISALPTPELQAEYRARFNARTAELPV